MSKYSRRDYLLIGNTIKKLSKTKRETEYRKWNKVFREDNPLYDSKRFKEYINI